VHIGDHRVGDHRGLIMRKNQGLNLFRRSLLGATVLAGIHCGVARADIDDGTLDDTGQLPLPSGQFITPTAATGSTFTTLNPGLAAHPNFVANGAIKTAVSPDGHTLLVMTSGYNLVANAAGTADDATSQYIFVYDISGGNEATPVRKQVIQVPDTYAGLVWAPGGATFYASGGSKDAVYVYSGSAAAGWSLRATIPMGHAPFVPASSPFYGLVLNGVGFEEQSSVAGLGLSADGTTLVAANIYNDSISVINAATNTVRFEYDLRPYNTSGTAGVAGGETPFTVVVANNTIAYVSSIRDREVDVVNIAGSTGSLITRISLPGSPNSIAGSTGSLITRISLPGNPNSMVLSADQSTLYVTQDNSDTVAVINTATNTVTEEISTIAPPGTVPGGTTYTGAAANNLALSPNNHTLYVTNGGANSVAVIPLTGPAPHTVSGLVPTAWYPHSISLSLDGNVMYVANGKMDPGANPLYETGSANQYILQLEGGGLLTVPLPGAADLGNLTAQVAANNGYSVPANPADAAMMSFLHQNIQHIIYIIKENRTFDQMLGDLTNGANGDPSLTMYGKRVTPNFHSLSQNFITLDNFFCSGEVSGNGWAWSTEARESDHGTKTIPPNYAGRGASNDSEGTNRDVNVGAATPTARDAALGGFGLYEEVGGDVKGGYANLLPGNNNDFATDGPSGAVQTGYIWDAALRAGLTVRDYGFFIDLSRYNLPVVDGGLVPSANASHGYFEHPFALGLKAASSTNPTFLDNNLTDPYFWGFDNSYPDIWRVEEWQREFNLYVTNNNLPNLTLLRLMHDHTGNFGGSDPAVAGINTLELQQADNDYAVGEVVQAVAHSPYAGNTLIFVVEDDAQDGPDHMDAHRSTAYVVGPYVKKNAVVSTRYTTVNMVRTIEDILGLTHLNLNDAYQRPMTDIFDQTQASWTYTATPSPYLKATTVFTMADPDRRFADQEPANSMETSAWLAGQTRGFDWSAADRVPTDIFNQIQWEALKPGVPYPTVRTGLDLRRRVVTKADTGK
jgi:YVTN family beta-propeller protein